MNLIKNLATGLILIQTIFFNVIPQAPSREKECDFRTVLNVMYNSTAPLEKRFAFIQHLIEKGTIDINARFHGETILDAIIRTPGTFSVSERVRIMEFVIHNQANINAGSGNVPVPLLATIALSKAPLREKLTIIRHLIERGIHTNIMVCGQPLLDYIIKNFAGDPSDLCTLITFLRQHGAKTSDDGALIFARLIIDLAIEGQPLPHQYQPQASSSGDAEILDAYHVIQTIQTIILQYPPLDKDSLDSIANIIAHTRMVEITVDLHNELQRLRAYYLEIGDHVQLMWLSELERIVNREERFQATHGHPSAGDRKSVV